METVRAGEITGWVRAGDPGQKVLLLHGGPGLGQDYLVPLLSELDGWTVASFQQRGLPPSTTAGPFDLDTAVADVVAFLDVLGWQRAVVAGHSWGGLLAWHVAAAAANRLDGVLSIDAVGAVGDLALPQFAAELRRRLSADSAAALAELEALEAERPLTAAEECSALELLWPSYFADAGDVPPFEVSAISVEANQGLMAAALERRDHLVGRLPDLGVRLGALVGELSPMPTSASSQVVDLVPGAWMSVVPRAGHFVWYEAPGSVADGLQRLIGR